MKMFMKAMISAAIIISTFTDCKNNKPVPEIIKPQTNISQYGSRDAKYLLGDSIRKMEQGTDYKPTKRVIYLYPHLEGTAYSDTLHEISAEDILTYQKNNISVSKRDCSVNSKTYLKRLKHKLNWWNILPPHEMGYKAFSFISKDFNIIDVYIIKIFMCDMRFFATDHSGRIAILIDENEQIVCILDNVKNEKEIFDAFGI